MQDPDNSDLFGVVMQIAPDAILVTDQTGRILHANPSAETLFQVATADLIGETVTRFLPDMPGPDKPEAPRSLPDGGDLRAGRHARALNGRRKDGTAVPLLLSAGQMRGADGAPTGQNVLILHDQTEHDAMQEAAARSNRMDAIGRMTGGIAHDFNNLLTVIIGNLEMLDGADLTAAQRAMLADALAAAELGADLTSRLTLFSRNSELRVAALDLNEQMAQALALLRHTIGTHCDIRSFEQDGLWTTVTDPTQLQTAILNLAMNSQDAMPEGGTLTLETQNVTIDDSYMAQELDVAPGRYVRLSVSDTGSGMGEHERTRALEPFFTTKAAGHGTGLGLSTVYGFVKQSGGYLTLYSEPGRGTIVALYFPALDVDPGPGATPAGAASDKPAKARHECILIVEDDAKLRRLTEARLNALGYTTRVASTADDAWEMIEANPDLALVFTDMVMPGKMSGYDLALRIHEDFPDIPVVLTSGFSEAVLRDRITGPGFRILRKPYRLADLQKIIQAELTLS